MQYDAFDIYLDAVERIIGFPYAEVVVSVVKESFNDGRGVDECAAQLLDDANQEEN